MFVYSCECIWLCLHILHGWVSLSLCVCVYMMVSCGLWLLMNHWEWMEPQIIYRVPDGADTGTVIVLSVFFVRAVYIFYWANPSSHIFMPTQCDSTTLKMSVPYSQIICEKKNWKMIFHLFESGKSRRYMQERREAEVNNTTIVGQHQ